MFQLACRHHLCRAQESRLVPCRARAPPWSSMPTLHAIRTMQPPICRRTCCCMRAMRHAHAASRCRPPSQAALQSTCRRQGVPMPPWQHPCRQPWARRRAPLSCWPRRWPRGSSSSCAWPASAREQVPPCPTHAGARHPSALLPSLVQSACDLKTCALDWLRHGTQHEFWRHLLVLRCIGHATGQDAVCNRVTHMSFWGLEMLLQHILSAGGVLL